MRVLVACEFSGIVRKAFEDCGHEAWSCDLIPSDRPGHHHQGDVRKILGAGWDLLICHPPCTYLCSSGLHWNTRRPERAGQTEAALQLVADLLAAPVARIALENPVGCISSRIRKPNQIVQPWQFGHAESKATCLWLKGLPLLRPTNVLAKPASGRWDNQTPSGQNKLGPSADRWKQRSLTYEGIAAAMADQWGGGWKRVVFAADCDDDGNCPLCDIDFASCDCFGPTQDGLEYEERADGELYARRLVAATGTLDTIPLGL